MEDCKYRLPCGRCDKFEDKVCDAITCEIQKNCEHNWELSSINIATNIAIDKCSKCGAIKERDF